MRGIDEIDVRSYVEEILSEMPSKKRVIVCGDWNTRVSDTSPRVQDVSTIRLSADVVTC
jgi:hypothetical protein